VSPARLEAFSDGVLAIVITIMVLELRAPHGADWQSLQPLLPQFLSYVLSFIYLAIYWNNHHHMLKLAGTVNGAILWANMHLLFWLSLVPFSTGWMGENQFAKLPVAIYGVTLLMPALAWKLLQTAIIKHQGKNSPLGEALGSDAKGWLSLALYLTGIGVALIAPAVSMLFYALVALMWLTPDRRFEIRLTVQG
jgi:uncharacterized membrane protein